MGDWLKLTFINSTYPQGTAPDGNDNATEDDYIDMAGDERNDVLYPGPDDDWAEQVYARAVHADDGSVHLQYWFWYFFNDGRFVGAFNHEGDWEHITVHLTSQLSPAAATYAQHEGHQRCSWAQVNATNSAGTASGLHPRVFVARGRHASYFHYKLPTLGNTDRADGGNTEHNGLKELHVMTTEHRWAKWPGRWGSTTEHYPAETNSPTGPNMKPQWSNPTDFPGEPAECDMPAVAASRRNRPVRPSPGELQRVAAPAIARFRRTRAAARIKYTIGKRGRPQRVLFMLRSGSGETASQVRPARSGHVRIELPPGGGPYELTASATGKRGSSRVVRTRVVG